MFQRPDTPRISDPGALRADGAVTIVAETAQGFEGDVTIARLLVRAAAAAGADVAKMQLVYADELTTPTHRHHGLFRGLEMDDAAWREIAGEARRCGIGLAFDVFGSRSLDLALGCGAHAIKIHASDVFNHGLVGDALDRAPHVYLSAGGISADELDTLLQRHHRLPERATVLYGFQAEPTATGENNFRRLEAYRRRFPSVRFGLMDHADGASDEAAWLAVLAVPLGASVIEKHLTLDRELEIEDYVSAVSPQTFSRFVARVRAAEQALGNANLDLTPAERSYRRKALKIVVGARDLAAGYRIGAGDIRLIRALLADQRAPIFTIEDAAGRTLRRPILADQPLYEDDLE